MDISQFNLPDGRVYTIKDSTARTKYENLNLTRAIIYSTITDLIQDADNLSEGMSATTLGYYTQNDGGGASYYIRTPLATDSTATGILQLTQNLVAEIIPAGDEVNVKQFGAYGDESLNNDDTTAIQNAIDYATTNSYILRVPAGTYTVNTLTAKNGLNMIGVNFQQSILRGIASTTTIFVGNSGNNNIFKNGKIANLTLLSDFENSTGNGFSLSLENSTIEHTICKGFLGGVGYQVTSVVNENSLEKTIDLYDCTAINCKYGFSLIAENEGATICNLTANQCTTTGIIIRGTYGWTASDLYSQDCGVAAISIAGQDHNLSNVKIQDSKLNISGSGHVLSNVQIGPNQQIYFDSDLTPTTKINITNLIMAEPSDTSVQNIALNGYLNNSVVYGRISNYSTINITGSNNDINVQPKTVFNNERIQRGVVYFNNNHGIPTGEATEDTPVLYREHTVEFNTPFSTTPFIILTQRTDTLNQQNVVIPTLLNANTNSFTFRIWRQVGSTTSSSPSPTIFWMAIDMSGISEQNYQWES